MTASIRFSKPCDECGGTGSIQVERVAAARYQSEKGNE